MKIYKEESQKIKKCTLIKCDMCKKEFTPAEWHKRPRNDIAGDNVFAITIRYSKTFSFYEYTDGEYLELDICVECWDGEVIPWLNSKNVNTELTEI